MPAVRWGPIGPRPCSGRWHLSTPGSPGPSEIGCVRCNPPSGPRIWRSCGKGMSLGVAACPTPPTWPYGCLPTRARFWGGLLRVLSTGVGRPGMDASGSPFAHPATSPLLSTSSACLLTGFPGARAGALRRTGVRTPDPVWYAPAGRIFVSLRRGLTRRGCPGAGGAPGHGRRGICGRLGPPIESLSACVPPGPSCSRPAGLSGRQGSGPARGSCAARFVDGGRPGRSTCCCGVRRWR